MRKALGLVLPLLLATTGSLDAQDDPGWELGTRAGFSILTNGSTLVSFGLPGGAPAPSSVLFGGGTSVHFGFFPGDHLMIEPQVNLNVIIPDGDQDNITIANLTGQFAYLFSGADTNSAYLGANGSLFTVSAGDTESDIALGANLGYRILVSDGAALRLEGAFRRWLDLEVNELNLALVFGVIFD